MDSSKDSSGTFIVTLLLTWVGETCNSSVKAGLAGALSGIGITGIDGKMVVDGWLPCEYKSCDLYLRRNWRLHRVRRPEPETLTRY